MYENSLSSVSVNPKLGPFSSKKHKENFTVSGKEDPGFKQSRHHSVSSFFLRSEFLSVLTSFSDNTSRHAGKDGP